MLSEEVQSWLKLEGNWNLEVLSQKVDSVSRIKDIFGRWSAKVPNVLCYTLKKTNKLPEKYKLLTSNRK